MTEALPPQPQNKLQPIPTSKTWKDIGMDLICKLYEGEEYYSES